MKKQAYAQLKPHLVPGEILLWCGRPATGSLLHWRERPSRLILLIVSGIWAVILARSLRGGGGGGGLLFMVTLILFIVWLNIIGDWHGMRRAVYGVTDQRVVIVESGIRTVVKSIGYGHLMGVTFTGARSFGTVRCARASMPWKNQNRPGRVSRPALFRRIFDAGDVCDLILSQRACFVDDLKQNARKPRSGAPAPDR